jgi:ABC-type transporter Mla subunit MlaD
MKTSKLTLLASNLALTVAVAILAGCASHNYDKGSATAAGLKESADRIQAADGQLDATLASLNNLVERPQADLRPQYKQFSDNVDNLASLAKHVDDSVTSMRANGKEFFAKWSEELAGIKNEDIRNRSAARQKEVSDALTDVKQSYARTETAFKPFMSDLRDIQKYLGTDLTPAGVASMKGVAAKANSTGAKLKKAVGKLTADFKSLGIAMSAVAPAPAK